MFYPYLYPILTIQKFSFPGSKSPIPLLVQETGLNIVLHSVCVEVPEVIFLSSLILGLIC